MRSWPLLVLLVITPCVTPSRSTPTTPCRWTRVDHRHGPDDGHRLPQQDAELAVVHLPVDGGGATQYGLQVRPARLVYRDAACGKEESGSMTTH